MKKTWWKRIQSKKPYPKAKAKINTEENTEKNKEEILDENVDKSKLKGIFEEKDKEGT